MTSAITSSRTTDGKRQFCFSCHQTVTSYTTFHPAWPNASYHYCTDCMDRDHAEALAVDAELWNEHLRKLNGDAGAQLDQIAAWVARHHGCCGDNAFATPERRIAHDFASARRWGSDADQLAAEQQYTAWTERFRAERLERLDRTERIAADEAEAHMEQDLADQTDRVAQAQAWLDRHGIYGRPADAERAMDLDHADASEINDVLNSTSHRCQFDRPDDEQPDSEQCLGMATDGSLYCQTHQDLHDDLMDQHREQDSAYQS